MLPRSVAFWSGWLLAAGMGFLPVQAASSFIDEFNGTSLDTNAWFALTDKGFNDVEKQYFIPSNVSVSGGNFVITSKKDSSVSGYQYTSGAVEWKTYSFLYGSVRYRAKMTGGQGDWPAIWMVGANCQYTNPNQNTASCNWPDPGSEEIDITEIESSNLTQINQQLHATGSGDPGCAAHTTDVSQNWHVYGLDWTPGKLIWTVDGSTTCTVTKNVPSMPMFMIMNVSMGGYGGTINDATLPQQMLVDYLRVVPQGVTPPPPPTTSRCDVNTDQSINVLDVQSAVNQALHLSACASGDIQQDGQCTVIDVQRVVNAILTQNCVTTP